MARRGGRGDVAVLARPADAPAIELADAVGRVLAQQLRQRLVAQAAARPRWCRRNGGCGASGTSSPSAAATVICAITVAPPRPIRLRSASKTRAAAARRFDSRIHAGGAGADHQHIGVDVDNVGVVTHPLTPVPSLTPVRSFPRKRQSITTVLADITRR